MEIKHPEVGICGLSCRLCPSYHTEAQSRCAECKSKDRIAVGCPFITCALKKRSLEFCWDCEESDSCEKWSEHRAHGKETYYCIAATDMEIDELNESLAQARLESALLSIKDKSKTLRAS